MIAEIVIDPATRGSIAEFVDAGIVSRQELGKFDQILFKTQRFRNSAISEIVLLVLAFCPVFLWQHEWGAGAISSWHTSSHRLTTAGWWYATVSTPLLRYITYRWGYRYIVWCVLLWRISHLNLTLVPTHPDHAGGLNFLGLAQRRFGVLFCALGCAFAGRMANSMAFEDATVGSFKYLIIGFMALCLLVGLLPLIWLSPRLVETRTAGLIEYGRLANNYTSSFDKKWVHCDEKPAEPLLGTGDIQSLADLANSFSIIDGMMIVPITKRLVIALAAQAALPIIPVIVLGTPVSTLVDAVIKMIS